MGDSSTLGDRSRDRFGRWIASPASVLVILPMLVLSVGVVVLMLGRKATRDSAETLVRRQLIAQAVQVQRDVDFTLDQADPVMAGLRLLAEPALATPDAMQRLHDLVVGRPGIYNTSIAFPVGVLWSTYKQGEEVRVSESRVSDAGTDRTNYGFDGGFHVLGTEPSHYDVRTRPHYKTAVGAKKRVWLAPHTFSTSHKTGLTVTEPIYDDNGLVAVITIDFDVESLSSSIGESPIQGARTVVFTPDGTMLAYPAVAVPTAAIAENRLLHYKDYGDARLDALFAKFGKTLPSDQRFFEFDAPDDRYFASTTHLGAKRAGTTAPVDWQLATLVPEHVLFDATQRLGRQAIIASAAAVFIALGVALVFAWNLVRMRRTVVEARAEARSARERAQQLGSYRLVAKLGAGGMGEVWRAEHQLLARQAAIKLVRHEVLADPKHAGLVRERFKREAQTVASLRSRHTIELYDYGVADDGSFFFVMELLDGLDLSQLVRTYGPQPAARVIAILTQACASLAEAHDAGLLHRDIKPANLFLSRAADEVDIVKLLDFGIAHNVGEILEDPIVAAVATVSLTEKIGGETTGERLTVEGSVIGTPGYIPPEQAVGAPLDNRGDLYALGCVAWWLLTGAEVYPNVSGDDLIRTHVSEPIPELRVRGWLPIELEMLVVQCLAKEPGQRPHDARALADALLAIQIPAEHSWTKAMATAWWKNLKAEARSTPEASTVDAEGAESVEQGTVVGKMAPPLLVPLRDGDGAKLEPATVARPGKAS
ncbi:MAG: protein kinase [Deltaproteobacteria bacterium]